MWAAVTEPGRLERWIGTWTGDPASGSVTFQMTAEAADVGPGREYYLDRLEAAETDGDVASIDFTGYYSAQREHYRSLFS